MTHYHYTEPYLLNPTHPVTVNLIGAGGNGSQMLNSLARIHTALVRLGHAGLSVCTWDPDVVTQANLGRQLFASGDIGLHKSNVLTTRINRFYGTRWTSKTHKYNYELVTAANITITCTDNIKSRKYIQDKIVLPFRKPSNHRGYGRAFNQCYYWLDLGNTKTMGQAILGTVGEIKQPKATKKSIPVPELPTMFDLFPPGKYYREKDDGPSCSLAEALEKQDLFVNSTLVQLASNLIWKMFRQARLQHHGVFLNLETLQTNPIPII